MTEMKEIEFRMWMAKKFKDIKEKFEIQNKEVKKMIQKLEKKVERWHSYIKN